MQSSLVRIAAIAASGVAIGVLAIICHLCSSCCGSGSQTCDFGLPCCDLLIPLAPVLGKPLCVCDFEVLHQDCHFACLDERVIETAEGGIDCVERRLAEGGINCIERRLAKQASKGRLRVHSTHSHLSHVADTTSCK